MPHLHRWKISNVQIFNSSQVCVSLKLTICHQPDCSKTFKEEAMSADQCRRVDPSFRLLDYKCERNGNHDTAPPPASLDPSPAGSGTHWRSGSALLHFLSSSYWFDGIPLLERNSPRVKGTEGLEVRKK